MARVTLRALHIDALKVKELSTDWRQHPRHMGVSQSGEGACKPKGHQGTLKGIWGNAFEDIGVIREI